MKKIFLPLLAASLSIAASSCTKKEGTDNTITMDSAAAPIEDSTVQADSAVLSNDSATVLTTQGVQDAHQNALQKEKADAQKMEADKTKVE